MTVVWESTGSRRGIGEVVGSISMLAITMALLGGASAVVLLSVHSAASLLAKSGEQQQRMAGVLVAVVGSQSNSTGAYVWLYDYGWASSGIQSVLVGATPARWSTSCTGDWTRSLCVVDLPPSTVGEVTIVIGGSTVVASV